MSRRIRFAALVATLIIVATAWPSPAAAQFRRGRRATVIVGGFYATPYWDPFWSPYFYPSHWGVYPSRVVGWGRDEASVRVQVTPREAQVFVDGYYAGIVDDFDGTFQRLHVDRGDHEITLYFEGYRTVRQRVYLSTDSTYKIKYTMERLGPGETAEKPIVAPPPAAPRAQGPQAPPPYGPGERAPREPREPREPRGPDVWREPGMRGPSGAIAIRVQPGNAEIYVDGERWQGPDTQDRLVIELPEGTHRVEVRKEGFDRFTANVQVRRGETSTLNVTLTRGGAAVTD